MTAIEKLIHAIHAFAQTGNTEMLQTEMKQCQDAQAAEQRELDDLKTQVGALGDQVAALKAAEPTPAPELGVDYSGAINDLNARLAALEDETDPDAASMTDLEGRIGALEARNAEDDAAAAELDPPAAPTEADASAAVIEPAPVDPNAPAQTDQAIDPATGAAA